MKQLSPLYSKGKKGKINKWSIQIEKDSYRIHFGVAFGTINITEWIKCENKEQAIRNAKVLWKEKLEEGYTEDINNIN